MAKRHANKAKQVSKGGKPSDEEAMQHSVEKKESGAHRSHSGARPKRAGKHPSRAKRATKRKTKRTGRKVAGRKTAHHEDPSPMHGHEEMEPTED